MITEIIFKSPGSKGINIVVAKPLTLESVLRCYSCGVELKAEEKEHKSVIKYYDSEGKYLERMSTYICFNCIEKLTGKRLGNE